MVMTDADDPLDGLLYGPDHQLPSEPRDESVAGAASGTPADGHGGLRAAFHRRARAGSRLFPGVRRRAAALEVDLSSITGSGRDGVITMADVEGAATQVSSGARPPAPARRPRWRIRLGRPHPRIGPVRPYARPEHRVVGGFRRTRRVDLGWADALAERRQAIRAVVDRRMVKFAAVRSSPSSPTLTSRRLTASAEARRSLPPGARDSARAVRSLPWGGRPATRGAQRRPDRSPALWGRPHGRSPCGLRERTRLAL